MGIHSLLPVLKPICFERHISEFRHGRAGVDGYSWLHKGAASCAVELCTGGETAAERARGCRRYVEYFMLRVRMLRHYQVEPVVVFDGGRVPAKERTEQDRRRSRDKHLALGRRELARGNLAAAEAFLQRAVDVTPHMALEVIRELRKAGVAYCVAPYEADAQLAYLSRHELVDVIITEDSDLVVYRAKRIFFKMDRYGYGELFEYRNLGAINEPNLLTFTPEMLMWMCVLAGCDFFEGVPGVGVRRAHQLVFRHRRLERIFHAIRTNPKLSAPPDLEDGVRRAVLAFTCHWVYDPTRVQLLHLDKPPAHVSAAELEAAIGAPLSDADAAAIAAARLCPLTREPLGQETEMWGEATVTEPTTAAQPSPSHRSLVRRGGREFWARVAKTVATKRVLAMQSGPSDAPGDASSRLAVGRARGGKVDADAGTAWPPVRPDDTITKQPRQTSPAFNNSHSRDGTSPPPSDRDDSCTARTADAEDHARGAASAATSDDLQLSLVTQASSPDVIALATPPPKLGRPSRWSKRAAASREQCGPSPGNHSPTPPVDSQRYARTPQ
ncbi:hypothetical protein CDCA_CDCA12G3387 [Cyanidium caldarium]|uniref:Exonuclease 1 n=1 Tax=Cyanidium caldarium TaxID=2771 RepID=A0AAV9IYG9_CYACA|nr:hypothetical protein CDCA_CDCA12G3387 [Cyanidium caldarium]